MVDIDYLSTREVAEILGVTRVRVWQLIQQGRLVAERWGRFYVIRRQWVELYQKKHK